MSTTKRLSRGKKANREPRWFTLKAYNIPAQGLRCAGCQRELDRGDSVFCQSWIGVGDS